MEFSRFVFETGDSDCLAQFSIPWSKDGMEFPRFVFETGDSD